MKNRGHIRIDGQEDATIIFTRFINSPDSVIEIDSTGKLTISFLSYFAVSISSSFEAHSLDVLSIALEYPVRTYINGGSFRTTALRVEFRSSGMFINSGDMRLLGHQAGRFEFKDLVNMEVLDLEANSADDQWIFDTLTNSGYIGFQYGPSSDVCVDAKGYVENTGLIEVRGSQTIGKVLQADDIYNEGLIRLELSSMMHSARIDGDGCWCLKSGAFIVLNPAHAFAYTQSIVLSDETANVELGGIRGTAEIYNLYGFLIANAPIHFSVDVDDVVYISTLGIPKIFEDGYNVVTFNIGMGYQSQYFGWEDNKITYNGNLLPTRELPSKCKCFAISDAMEDL